MYRPAMARFFAIILTLVFTSTLFGATSKKPKHRKVRAVAASVVRHTPFGHLAKLKKKRYAYSPWTTPTFADSTAGDMVDGEDLTVRRAAVQALGPYNGTIVVVDPQTGRLLTIVNQKLAFKSGFEPCSTIKLVAALAGLEE